MKIIKKDSFLRKIPTDPGFEQDRRERERFRKRVLEVIAKVETDESSKYLFEPASDVIRRKHMNDEIRAEIAAAIMTEYELTREHASRREVLLGHLNQLTNDAQQQEPNEENFEDYFFQSVEFMLRHLYETYYKEEYHEKERI